MEMKMACNCKNSDGTMSDKCYGTCKKHIIVEQEMQQQRDPLNGFAELILVQVDDRIERALNKFHVSLQKELSIECKDVFLDGFYEGFKFYRKFHDDED